VFRSSAWDARRTIPARAQAVSAQARTAVGREGTPIYRIAALAAIAVWLVVASSGVLRTEAFVRPAADELSVALTGDSLITRPLSSYHEPTFLRLAELIRSQDAAFTNLETTLHDYEMWAMVESGGIHLRAAPAMARELVSTGFRLASVANNHIADWGVEGMRLTRRHAEAAGLQVAGAGEDLAAARQATRLQTAKGHIALVAAASTFTANARAGNAADGIPARPGLSPLRFTTTNVLTPAGMAALRTVAKELGQPVSPGDRITFQDQLFLVGERPGRRTEPHRADLEEIAAAVRVARASSDLTIVSVHAHEGGANAREPAEFLVTFARSMIDAGADVFVGHGPHVLRGIEIYKGRPIFYSLGNFIFENETVERLPSDDFERLGADPAAGVAGLNDARYSGGRRGFRAEQTIWESVVAVPRWRNRVLVAVDLYPVSLGYGRPQRVRGRPVLADPALARKILSDLRRLSAPFGTTITSWNGIGRIVPDTGVARP
jgi:poly-gamma-glutamate synthesis protein (capsule biosynthesis protein)